MPGKLLYKNATLGAFLASYGLLIAALVLECIVFEVIAQSMGLRSFLSTRSFINILDQSVEYGILAVGMTFVILTGGIDLSVGSVLAFGGVVCALVVLYCGEPVWLALILGWGAALAMGLLAGNAAGFFITVFRIQPFIATLALMSSLRGLGFILAGGRSIAPLPEAYTFIGRYKIGGHAPVGVVIMIAVFLAAAVVLNYTSFGRHVRAIGGSEESARLSGVPVNRVKWIVYVLCSGLAALGGMISSAKLGSGDPKSGFAYELFVIAAVVVGGTSLSGGRGGIGGTFIGLMIVSALGAGINWIGVGSFGQQVTLGLAILGAVLLDRIKGARI